MTTRDSRAAVRTFFVCLIFLGLAVYLFEVLLLFFAAALLAVVFRTPSEWLARKSGLDPRVALAIVLALIAGSMALSLWLVGTSIIEQIGGVSARLPEAVEEVRERLSRIAIFKPVVENGALQDAGARMIAPGVQAIGATLGMLSHFGLVLFVAVLLAAQPAMYVDGSLHLLPKRHRARAREVLHEVGHTLRRWILGQLCLMALVGTLTYVSFTLIGVEFAGALGLLAGGLTFIPFLGSLIAGVIAVLVALTQGPDVAIYAAAAYVGVQIVENLCEPLVQQRAVYLAPALLLFAQVVMGTLGGALGIIVATPLAAAVIVVTKMLYVQDSLDDQTVSPSG